jgi:hypothetical protein
MTLTGVNVTSLVQMPQRVCGHSAAFPFEGHPVQRCVLPGVQIQHKLGPALMLLGPLHGAYQMQLLPTLAGDVARCTL